MNSTKPTLLIFTDWYLPAYRAGGPVRSVAHIAEALQNEFDIRIVCRDRDYLEAQPFRGIATDIWLERDGVSVMYLSPERQKYRPITNLISGMPISTTVYVNGIFSVVFSGMSLWAGVWLKRRVVLAPRGMLAPAALAIKPIKKKLFLFLMKTFGRYSTAIFHATSKYEAVQINEVLGVDQNRIKVIPNMPGQTRTHHRIPKQIGSLRMLQVARVAPEKNMLFAIEILKNIPEHCTVSLQIVGPFYDQAYYRRCQEAAAKLPAHISVVFSGSMQQAAIEALYPTIDLLFLPTLGENYGHAIIDAMLHGCPVLISDCTPWRRLAEQNLGAELKLTDQHGFVDFICTLASMDETDYQEAYAGLSQRAASLIHRDKLISSYTDLFYA